MHADGDAHDTPLSMPPATGARWIDQPADASAVEAPARQAATVIKTTIGATRKQGFLM
jgi:hypothetical protein